MGGAAGNGITGWGYPAGIYWDPQGNPWALVGPEWDNVTRQASGSSTTDVNNQGVSVGSAYDSNGSQVAMMWRGGYSSGAVKLESAFVFYGPPIVEWANAISRNGEMVAGEGYDYRGPDTAEMWKNGKLVMRQSYAHGYGINDSGTMVGDMGVGPNTCSDNFYGFECLTYVATMWGPHAVKLALLPGTTSSTAWAINNSNVVAGTNAGRAGHPQFHQAVLQHQSIELRPTLAASNTSITHGQPVKLTATVVPAFGTIAGTVTFKNGTTVLGTATVNGSTKQATLSPVLKTAGQYSITASYSASTNFAGSTSTVVMVTAK